MSVMDEIERERECQKKCGLVIDDENTLNDWITFINCYLFQAAGLNSSPANQRFNLLQAATVIVAAIEAFDRNGEFVPRHYENYVSSGKRQHG